MKKILITIFLCHGMMSIAQERMIVHMKDGSTVAYNMADVSYVELEKNTAANSPSDTITGVGGTAAVAVDLGLSVKWASHNIGATLSSEDGIASSWQESSHNATLWGEGWRVPTENEWQELYEKCSWEWVTRDGNGGRLITGPSGNSIFIPASGLTLGNKKHVIGSVGIYWSATPSLIQGEAASGTYFDSANIYRMDFPKTNKFATRLVKDM